MLIFWVYAAFSFGPSPPFPNAPGPCVMVSPSGPFSFLLSLASACPTHEKSHRLLRAGRIRPRQGFPFAHNHFHRWKRIGSSTAGNHPAPGGERDGGELYETHLQTSWFFGRSWALPLPTTRAKLWVLGSSGWELLLGACPTRYLLFSYLQLHVWSPQGGANPRQLNTHRITE